MHIPSCRYIFSHYIPPWLSLFILLIIPPVAQAGVPHHEIVVNIDPKTAEMSVEDNISLPAGNGQFTFTLYSGFKVSSTDGDLELVSRSADKQVNVYQLNTLPEQKKVQLHYSGKVQSQERKGIFGMPNRMLNDKMLYLDGSSHWLPGFSDAPLKSFELVINQPEGWEIISQGKAVRSQGSIRYQMPKPQDDVYLIGGPYTRYSKSNSDTEVEIFLLNENPGLAEKYLDASLKYLDIYSDWIGPYPYKKFAVVENHWQTGYGMPSFTLLGSNVIRLPFILYTSLPHEILHNWWGNGVFVDYREGNWSEGLTAYMADHFSNQQRGQDPEYRRKALERYANFASKKRDIALRDFTSRHDEASQAIGYSKSMMLFHMLRKMLGEQQFNHQLQIFWQKYKFNSASFPELINQLLAESDIDQQQFISQWLNRKGAPEIILSNASVKQNGEQYVLDIGIQQQQEGKPYEMTVPLQIMFASGHSRLENIKLGIKGDSSVFRYADKPTEVQLDPEFDVFRLLHPDEKPASLGRLFGSEKQLLVYPGQADADQVNAWRQLAATWEQKYKNITLMADSEVTDLPENTAVWILGWENRLLDTSKERLQSDSQKLMGKQFVIDDRSFKLGEHAVVLLDNQTRRSALGFIGAMDETTIMKLARKLPHYNSYGRLVFDVPSAKNIVKQHLDVTASPLRQKLD